MAKISTYASVTPADGDSFLISDASDSNNTKTVTLENLKEVLIDFLANVVLQEGSNVTITYDDVSGTITLASSGGGGEGGAPTDATYVTQTPNGNLSAEQALSLLSTGIVKVTTTTGVLSTATPDTDYARPVKRTRAKTGSTPYFSLPGVPVGAPSSTGTFGLTAAFLHYMPIEVTTAITLDRFAFEVTTQAAASSKMRCGIYESNIDLAPGSLIIDSGEMAIDSLGVVTATINQTLSPGIYLLATLPQANVGLRRVLGSTAFLTGFRDTLGSSTIISELYAAQTYGALPSTGPAWTAGFANQGIDYHIFVRVSAP